MPRGGAPTIEECFGTVTGTLEVLIRNIKSIRHIKITRRWENQAILGHLIHMVQYNKLCIFVCCTLYW